MGLITTAEELADAIVTDPERVAACLGRINRVRIHTIPYTVSKRVLWLCIILRL